MTAESRVTPDHEYTTLRDELLEAKRFVFERPLAIAALAGAGLQVSETPIRLALPVAVALLTVFNFWFTVNRLQSASRIVAYIQLVLEPSAKYAWQGWETSLRSYRRWLKSRTPEQAAADVDAHVDKGATPDALMYFPAIYYFHVALIVFSVSVGILQVGLNRSAASAAAAAGVVGVSLWSVQYFRRWTPGRLSASIERNRAIWKAAFEEGEQASQKVV